MSVHCSTKNKEQMSPDPREMCEKLEKRFSCDLNYGNATTEQQEMNYINRNKG